MYVYVCMHVHYTEMPVEDDDNDLEPGTIGIIVAACIIALILLIFIIIVICCVVACCRRKLTEA